MEKTDTYYFHQTPKSLCDELIKHVPLEQGDRVLESFRGEGNFYNSFPPFIEKDWCEIVDGRDYKDYDKEFDWVITNPPFRLEEDDGKRTNAFYKLLNYYSQRAKKGIAFLANDTCFSTLTPSRLKELNGRGWFIHKIVCCAIKKWRGRYFFIIFKRQPCDFYNLIDGSF